MANAVLSLYDLATLQRNDVFTGLVEDVTTYAPEFSTIPVVQRAGTEYTIVRRTALPAAGFRAINNGISSGKSQFKKERKEMFFLDSIIEVDEAVYKGQDGTAGDILSIEAQGALQQAVITIGSQFYYGTVTTTGTAPSNATAAFGFPGMRSQLSGVITAGATTNSTSAYLLWLNPQGVHFDVGRDGEFAMAPFMRQKVSAKGLNATGDLFAWVSNISCWIGAAVISTWSVWAVVGIDNNTHVLTDKIGAQLISLIPLNRRQGLVWYMNPATYFGLQGSRTSIGNQPANGDGAPAWSVPPEKCNGYPIIQTNSVVSTESN